MSDEDILQVSGVAAGFCIEICTAVAESTVTDNLHHGLSQFEIVNRELVGVPAVLSIATVGIDRA